MDDYKIFFLNDEVFVSLFFLVAEQNYLFFSGILRYSFSIFAKSA
jgi:hypothetical protein